MNWSRTVYGVLGCFRTGSTMLFVMQRRKPSTVDVNKRCPVQKYNQKKLDSPPGLPLALLVNNY